MSNNRDYDQIFIKDLTILMSAGIYDHEKATPQRVVFNLTIDVVTNKGKTLSSIDDVVSYENVANTITKIATSKHYELLEELAEEITTQCLSHKQVRTIKLTIEKPDIIEATKSVGITICRHKA